MSAFMTRVVVLGCAPALRERLRAELSKLGAELVVADDQEAALDAIELGGIGGVVAHLDPGLHASGLGFLLAARMRIPHARRVLVVDRRAALCDAAIATGIVDRVITLPLSSIRVGLLADWLSDVCDHGPRPGLMSANLGL